MTQTGNNAYIYDANGNMLTGGGRTITWDVENRPVSISKSGVTTTFIYDGDGKRIKQTVGGVTTLYINKYFEKTGNDNTTNYYLGSKLIAVKQGANLSYIMQDHLGSTIGGVDTSGITASTINYLPFGLTRSSSGATPTEMKFTGQRLDTTGLYYYGARYYDPGIGRFISPDPIVHTVPLPEGRIIEPMVVSLSNTQNQFKGNETRSLYREIVNPQELNRYSYVLNNPLKYIDPTGNQVNAAAQLSQDAWQLSNSLPPGWQRWVVAGGAVVLGLVGWIWYQASNNSSNNDAGKSKSDNSGNTANGDPNNKLPTNKELSNKAGELDPADKGGQYTKAGRALQKHGGRPGSAFNQPTGNPQEINQQGQRVVDNILNNSGSKAFWNKSGNIEVRSPDGRGIEFKPDGTMIGFLEP